MGKRSKDLPRTHSDTCMRFNLTRGKYQLDLLKKVTDLLDARCLRLDAHRTRLLDRHALLFRGQ